MNESAFQNIPSQFPVLTTAIKKLRGASLYLVGGAVRDILLNRPTTDYDFIATGVPLNKLEEALAKHGKVNIVGKQFGVLKFHTEDHPEMILDIALPRTEHSWGLHGGYKEFDVQSDPALPIEKDLERRDFTINAMAVRMHDGQLIDPFDGQKDLERRLIRCVGKPRDRLMEDHTRILRALRFACELDFEIEKETWQAMKDRMVGVADPVIPKETIGKEFAKSFRANPGRAFDLYEASGGFTHLMPELHEMIGCEQPEEYHTEGDVWTHTRLALDKLLIKEFDRWFPDGKRSLNLILGLLFHDIGKPRTKQTPQEHGTDRVRFNNHDVVGSEMAEEILNRLKVQSTGMINQEHIVWLVRNHLVVTKANVYEMRPTTIEKYFLDEQHDGMDLLKLIFADTNASPDRNGKIHTEHIEGAMERIKEVRERGYHGTSKPKLLVNGNDIMLALKIPEGHRVGELLEKVREAQLSKAITTKDEAMTYLKSLANE